MFKLVIIIFFSMFSSSIFAVFPIKCPELNRTSGYKGIIPIAPKKLYLYTTNIFPDRSPDAWWLLKLGPIHATGADEARSKATELLENLNTVGQMYSDEFHAIHCSYRTWDEDLFITASFIPDFSIKVLQITKNKIEE